MRARWNRLDEQDRLDTLVSLVPLLVGRNEGVKY